MRDHGPQPSVVPLFSHRLYSACRAPSAAHDALLPSASRSPDKWRKRAGPIFLGKEPQKCLCV